MMNEAPAYQRTAIGSGSTDDTSSHSGRPDPGREPTVGWETDTACTNPAWESHG